MPFSPIARAMGCEDARTLGRVYAGPALAALSGSLLTRDEWPYEGASDQATTPANPMGWIWGRRFIFRGAPRGEPLLLLGSARRWRVILGVRGSTASGGRDGVRHGLGHGWYTVGHCLDRSRVGGESRPRRPPRAASRADHPDGTPVRRVTLLARQGERRLFNPSWVRGRATVFASEAVRTTHISRQGCARDPAGSARPIPRPEERCSSPFREELLRQRRRNRPREVVVRVVPQCPRRPVLG